jgi:hypothetical protein
MKSLEQELQEALSKRPIDYFNEGVAKGIADERARCAGICDELISRLKNQPTLGNVAVGQVRHRILAGEGKDERISKLIADSLINKLDNILKESTPTPPDGYELVMDKEAIIEKGWLFYRDNKWRDTRLEGSKVGTWYNVYARPITQPARKEGDETCQQMIGQKKILPAGSHAPEPTPQADAKGAMLDYINLYNELIYAVARKFPNETRHQTALRYIREAENQSSDDQLYELDEVKKRGLDQI